MTVYRRAKLDAPPSINQLSVVVNSFARLKREKALEIKSTIYVRLMQITG